ncbi:biotin transport system substrate-specific component [Geodermatophilus bullaregiensis]|uniref:biotin transporter BioY n=1 Tax=Geodermatophilus bullaregiensis TaxID=1564160 RepID=UPI00195B2256|nr:biotin transporter BioY [Geodermatophilus bullaregiensis]MBM7807982.1 biotin transport system substrate-specific component [Geodermatophilus bullaregiensis]
MKTRDLAYVALFAAIIAVLGTLPAIPIGPVPITAQTLGVMLAGSVLGARRGFLAVLLFLVLVAVGLPLLASGAGGLAPFAGPTAGYLFSWPVAAFVIGWLTERSWDRYSVLRGVLFNVVGGIVVVYAVGVPVLKAVSGLSWGAALTGGAVPFLPGDLFKAFVAAAIADVVRRSYPVIERPRRTATTR